MHIGESEHVHMNTWKSEVSVWSLPQLLSTLFSETQALSRFVCFFNVQVCMNMCSHVYGCVWQGDVFLKCSLHFFLFLNKAECPDGPRAHLFD